MGDAQSLKRILGTPTAFLIGMGVAIGSGIFRNPGIVAGYLESTWLILAAWMIGGVVALCQGLVSAELATRFPRSGGEYVYLREAYGEFVAFFFGWAYTIFIIGGATGVIALAFGDFACELFAAGTDYAGGFAAAAIVAVTIVNLLGLRAGAGAQNALTILKIVALLAIVAVGLGWGSSSPAPAASVATSGAPITISVFLAAMLFVFWSFDGTTDAVKMAEEIKDVRRALPRALILSALSIAGLYLLVNAALLRLVPAEEMNDYASVPGEALRRVFGETGRRAVLVVAMLACLGAISSMVLATVRVTFALARDGLTFRFMSRMSKAQAPIPALIVVACFALLLVTNRSFEKALGIYYFAAAVLFGLAYGSLIVFRLREQSFPRNTFRAPAGPLLAALLIIVQFALAVNVALTQPRDALLTTLLLAFFVVLYFVWKRFAKPTDPADSCY